MLDTIFNDLYDLGKSINKIFEVNPVYRYAKWPETNVYANNEEYVVALKIPGVEKKDISLTIKDNSLKINGERKKENNENYHLNERYSGKFERNILLDEKVMSDKIEAQLKNGLLIVKLPKSPEVKPKTINIK
jgi:HSP20 family protein